MSWVYVQSEPKLWTTGFYGPDGKWNPDEDFSDRDAARARAAYLNGSPLTELERLVWEIIDRAQHNSTRFSKPEYDKSSSGFGHIIYVPFDWLHRAKRLVSPPDPTLRPGPVGGLGNTQSLTGSGEDS